MSGRRFATTTSATAFSLRTSCLPGCRFRSSRLRLPPCWNCAPSAAVLRRFAIRPGPERSRSKQRRDLADFERTEEHVAIVQPEHQRDGALPFQFGLLAAERNSAQGGGTRV